MPLQKIFNKICGLQIILLPLFLLKKNSLPHKFLLITQLIKSLIHVKMENLKLGLWDFFIFYVGMWQEDYLEVLAGFKLSYVRNIYIDVFS